MLIATKKSASALPELEKGIYTGICCGVVDLGEQAVTWGKQTKYQNKVQLIFEICGEFVDVEGEKKPRWMSREFTRSLSEKSNLAKAVQAWYGELPEELDLSALLGKACQLSIVEKEKKDGSGIYTMIDSIFGLPKGMEAPALISEKILFDMDAADAAEVFETLPEWMQKKIGSSTTWASQMHGQGSEINADELTESEDPPF